MRRAINWIVRGMVLAALSIIWYLLPELMPGHSRIFGFLSLSACSVILLLCVAAVLATFITPGQGSRYGKTPAEREQLAAHFRKVAHEEQHRQKGGNP